MKAVGYILGYLALLIPCFLVALFHWVNMVDPPTLEVPHSFWLTPVGEWLYFGAAFVAPLLILVAFRYAMRYVWKGV
jgi:hypothetical protein